MLQTDNLDLKIFLIAGAGTFLLLAIFIVLFVVGYYRKQIAFMKQKNEIHKFQKVLLNTQLEVQEQTFQTISQEIHDNLGQVLSLVKLNLNVMEKALPEVGKDKLITTKELVSKAITDLRNLSKSLNTDMIREIGLKDCIERELSLITRTGQHKTLFSIEGEAARLDNQKELILFRMFQELLNNIIKHAAANTVIVRLTYKPESFNLIVADDGQGFEIAKIQSTPHFGLGIRNMQNRASLIGATFKFDSSPGKGTTVSIELP
ncbi:MAG TPA: sensor histidine kinase, partial [Chitinophagaceae bacterium]|nr:sensor histidine kinase [Chitinophagaceae bacterium]